MRLTYPGLLKTASRVVQADIKMYMSPRTTSCLYRRVLPFEPVHQSRGKPYEKLNPGFPEYYEGALPTQ